jgi:hypothetical protein
MVYKHGLTMRNIINRYLISLLLISYLEGCGYIDSQKAVSKKIIGNIYIINLRLPEHPGSYLVFEEKSGYERQVLKKDENVDFIRYNDSVLLIKTLRNPEIHYYLIKHDKGTSILNNIEMTEIDFASYDTSFLKKVTP